MSSPASVDAAGQPSILINMTTGIELEFLAYTPKNVKPKAYLLKALRAPVTLKCSKCAASHSWDLPFAGKLDHQGDVSPFCLWSLTSDMSVVPCRKTEEPYVPKDSAWYNMELKSRIINFARPTTCPLGQTYPCTGEPFLWDANTEISAFVQRIHEAFSGPGYCVATNGLTGLHIHLGNFKDIMPVKSSLGMFSLWTALERIFDEVLPVSRIGMEKVAGPLPGIDRPHAVYKYDDALSSDWVGSCSRVFLEMLRRDVKKAFEKGPESARSTIIDQLKSCNVPAWLAYISTFDTVKLFRDTWPSNQTAGTWLSHRSLAVNLTNLEIGYGNKDTVEIRAAPGSLDLSEISAWYDLMGKLMLWLSDPNLIHRSIIESLWANPESSILDLAKQVGALQFTIDFYADRLTADWAQRRFDHLTSNLDSNTFKSFIHAIESNRLHDYRSQAVRSKVSHKLEAGYYGQLSNSIFQRLPVEVQAHPNSPIMNMDTCDYEAWTDNIIANVTTVFAASARPRLMPSWNAISPSWPPPSGSASSLPPAEIVDLFNHDDSPRARSNLFNRPTAAQNTPVLGSPSSISSLPPTPTRASRYPQPNIGDLADLLQQRINNGTAPASSGDVSMSSLGPSWASPVGATAANNTADNIHSDNASNASSEEFPSRNTNPQDRTFAVPPPTGGFSDTRPETSESEDDDVEVSRPESPDSESSDDDVFDISDFYSPRRF
ncbi:hypothetical protein E4T38_03458 [Aureobasidium subglaciale]|nr:hypothetical protein E4T38_03458 [Aureobasidium subglaciale]KAI5229590.1 hypothetical protein E4T41_03455 [Aureobasidium subglaciale]KAI5264278.1 hypothetical protein E4T46_03232 [Aureobasidium subglaciale]